MMYSVFGSDFEKALGEALGGIAKELKVTGIAGPAVDLRNQEDKYILEMDLPGYAKEDISIEVKERTLSISSKKEQEKGEGYLIRERTVRPFTKAFRMPTDVDEKSMTADLKDGILTVIAPKKAQEKPKAIEVKVN